MAKLFLELIKYSEDEARDELGRWTSGGGYAQHTGEDFFRTTTGDAHDLSGAQSQAVQSYLDDPQVHDAASLDAAIASSKVAGNTLLYRGLAPGALTTLADLGPGQIVRNPDYMIATGSQNLARDAAGHFGGVLALQVPKGYPGLRVPIEGVLLPRDTTVSLVHVDKENHVIMARVVPLALKMFDPVEPRDQGGKWTTGGTDIFSSSNVDERTKTAAWNYFHNEDSKLINQYMRGISEARTWNLEHSQGSVNKDKIDHTIKALTEAFDKYGTKLTEDTTVYRGLNSGVKANFGNLSPGDTVTDKAFVSTTTDRSWATGFSTGGVMKITLPAGTSVIRSNSGNEHEMLLRPGSQFVYQGHASRDPAYAFTLRSH